MNEEIEFQITQTNGMIEDNFEEVKLYLDGKLDEYRTAVFTDESIKMAKSVVADLRKQQTAVKSRISDVKKFYMRPFEEFKAKADELVVLYDEPINFINAQVVAYTEKQKGEKRKLIKEMYEVVFEGMTDYPLESIYNSRWENATYTKSNILEDLTELRNKITDDTQTIIAFGSDAVPEALELYKKDYNLQNAIAHIQRYERTRADVMEKEREKELERIRQQEREKILAEQKAEEEKKAIVEETKADVINSFIPEDDGTNSIGYVYGITLTDSEKEALEMYMDSIGIEWEVLS